MFVYKITNKVNDKNYIGYDTNNSADNKRWIEHKRSYKRNVVNKVLYYAMNKYGINNFSQEIIEETITMQELKSREIFWINF